MPTPGILGDSPEWKAVKNKNRKSQHNNPVSACESVVPAEAVQKKLWVTTVPRIWNPNQIIQLQYLWLSFMWRTLCMGLL